MSGRVSFAVHSYDEAEALGRLIRSSLPMAGRFHEWVVLDHRSSDGTDVMLEEMRPELKALGIGLKTLREERDLSRSFTFADVRTATIKSASHPIVVILDADFIIGPAFPGMLDRAVRALAGKTRYATASLAVPVVWDRLVVDGSGNVVEHGRVWVHRRRPRVLLRDCVSYQQTKDGGRWERLVVRGPRKADLHLTHGSRGLTPGALLSVNVKPAERIALRDGMTMFMQDAIQGRVTGDWLENHRAGKSRSQGPYDYQSVSLKGWRLNLPSLDLAS